MGKLVKKNIHIFMLFKSASANRKTNHMACVLYRKPFQKDKEKQAEIQYGYGTKVCTGHNPIKLRDTAIVKHNG